MIRALEGFWADRGCVLMQPYHTEVGAGTMNPATFLRCLGPKPWRAAYVEPVIRPSDGRYGENPFRFQHYFQYQVVLKPSPPDVLDLYFGSLRHLGIELERHDVRLVEDDWENPTIGAWGLGWEVWMDGMEVTQWTYFQQLGGLDVDLVTAEMTYGLERLALFLQGKRSAFELEWAPGVNWGDVYREAEREWSQYNFEEAPVETLMRRFEEHEAECRHLLERGLPLPAYDQVLKASHTFNLLEARGAISVTARAAYIGRVRDLARTHLGVEPTKLYVGPRRLAVRVDDLPERTPDTSVKGPPEARREQAAAGFARKHGLLEEELEVRDGLLWARVPGEELRGEVLLDRLRHIVHGLAFTKSMRWDESGQRFARPIRWACEKLDEENLWGDGRSYGRRFFGSEVEVPSAQAYAETLRAAGVEPDAAERERLIREGLDALGGWSDPAGVLREVIHLVEWPFVLEASFDERYLALPERVIQAPMQKDQRYFPLGGNRFAVVANGGEPEIVRAGHVNVLESRLEDASFTFERDVKKGIDALAAELGSITFFAGAGTFADKTERLIGLVERLGGGDASREAARLAKADQASELVREFPELEGAAGAEYARLAGYPEAVAKAIEEQYLPDAADAPLPETEAGKVLAAADKIDTLSTSFGLGHRPSGSRDPYGLRRAAIGLDRLALEGGLTIERSELPEEVRDFVEERLGSLLDVPVEYVRAA